VGLVPENQHFSGMKEWNERGTPTRLSPPCITPSFTEGKVQVHCVGDKLCCLFKEVIEIVKKLA
jgi:hypothetical protein